MNHEIEILDKTQGESDLIINMYTYQHGRYVAEAIDSVLMQKTTHSWKLLIMDDGSTDETQVIIRDYQKRYPDKIILAICKENSNGQFQKDILYKYKNVEYINVIDGDDYWIDDLKIEKQLSFLDSHPEFIGVTGNVKNINEDGSKQHCDFDLYPFRERHIFGRENVLRMEQVSHCSALMFRNYYKEWDESKFERMYFCKANEDRVYSAVLGMLGDIYYSHEIYTDHRRVFTGTSWTAQTHGKNNAALICEMWEDLYRLIFEMFGERIQMEDSLERMKAMIGREIKISNKVDEQTKQRNISRMFEMWSLSKQGGKSIEETLVEDGVRNIAIYGLAELGLRLFYELKDTSVKVVYGIDKNTEKCISELDCFHEIPDKRIDTDAIVVTALTTYDDIKEELNDKGYSCVIALDELLYRMIPDDEYLRGTYENM